MAEKENSFSKQNLKIFFRDAFFVVFVAVAATALLGYFAFHWTTWYQFAEGLTWAGALVLAVGASGPLGFWRQTRSLPYQYASTRTDVELYDRMRNENREAQHVYRFMYLFFASGLLTIGLAILIHRLIG
jgi:hypothetical protein